MSPFDLLIVQPIFNILIGVYGLIPDFGIAIIILSILVRLALWPLLRRQLHQSKLMRQYAPEIKKIRDKTKTNIMLQRQMMTELYKEKGIKPFSPFLILIIQIPILIALFTVIQTITLHRDRIAEFTYPFLKGIGPIKDLLANPTHFNERLFGVVDLTQVATHSVVILLFVLATAFLQYIQTKQVLPSASSNRRLRDIMRETAEGKEADQAEISAVMSQRMAMITPIITLVVMLNLPGALVLYYGIGSAVAILQQRHFLRQDTDEMTKMADMSVTKPGKKATAKARAKAAREAEVVTPKQEKR